MGVLTADEIWVHWDAMLAAGYSVLGCKQQAYECAADAVTQMLERPPRNVRNPEAFLVTVAKRRAIDRVRSHGSDRRRLERLVANTQLVEQDVAEAVTERAEAAWVDEQARTLLRPTAYRLLQLLADGVPIQEAALALGLTQRAAESHLLRARRLMRSAIAKTLVTLGVLGGILRRGVTKLPAAVAAVSALFLVIPHGSGLGQSSSRRSLAHFASSELRTALPARHESRTQPSATPSAQNRERATFASAASTPRAAVQTSVVGVGTYDKDDGYQASGPVDLVLHCAGNVRVEPGYVGCDQPSPSPSPNG
jgi:DNA-directed RNA polymerase specialized sigma24 family protein